MARRRVQDGEAQQEMNGDAHPPGYADRPPVNAREAAEMADAEVAFQTRKAELRAGVEQRTHALAPVTNIMTASAPETITVTWGEELFTPVQFCSFRVGPYTASSSLRAGESREQAADRLMRELERIAAKERDIKIRVYREGLEKVVPRKGA